MGRSHGGAAGRPGLGILENTLVDCQKLNSPVFQRPRGCTVTKAAEAPQDPYTGEVHTQAVRAAQHRKRILQQLLILHGRPGRDEAVRQFRTALGRDPALEWAVWGMFPFTQAALEDLVGAARAADDEALGAARESRRGSWHKWCLAESAGSMRSLYRHIKQ